MTNVNFAACYFVISFLYALFATMRLLTLELSFQLYFPFLYEAIFAY